MDPATLFQIKNFESIKTKIFKFFVCSLTYRLMQSRVRGRNLAFLQQGQSITKFSHRGDTGREKCIDLATQFSSDSADFLEISQNS